METGVDFYALARTVNGLPLNGELDSASGWARGLVDRLSCLPVEHRLMALECYLVSRADRDAFIRAVADVDPEGPCPEPSGSEPIRPATLADIRRIMAEVQWLWEGYIPASRISGIAAFEGIGKTRFAMDLARRLWCGEPWPDGQAPTFPSGTPTLWVCADGQQDDLAAMAQAMGLPDEAVLFNTTPEEPYGGTELDKAEDRERLERFIIECRPGLVFVDTLTNATSYDLCRATENKAMMTPLRDISQRTKTSILPLLHLSKEGQALGRRIKGITRTIIQLDCPDPDHQPGRLRLWVPKSFAKKPPALGVTMGDAGNTYDHNPPTPPEPSKPGRPAEARDKAEQFIRDCLAEENDRIATEMAAECATAGKGSKATFWRAVEALETAGEITRDGGTGTGKQVALHLIIPEPAPEPDRPF